MRQEQDPEGIVTLCCIRTRLIRRGDGSRRYSILTTDGVRTMSLSKAPLAAAVCLIAIGIASTVPVPAKAQMRDPSQLLARADLNGDGQITRQEFVSARAEVFTRLDRNGDGHLSTADAPRRLIGRQKAKGRIRDLMQSLDTNRDGRVSREEFVNGPVRLFAVADSDGNDVIDRNELAAFRANAANLRQR